MTTHHFISNTRAGLLGILGLITIAATTAGGFQLHVEVPEDESDIVMLVRTYGCHQPQNARVSATAEGVVEGKRLSRSVELNHISKGVYAVKQQWPDEGRWVLAISGEYEGMHTSTLVTLAPNGKVAARTTKKGTEPNIRMLSHKLSSSDIEQVLKHLATADTRP